MSAKREKFHLGTGNIRERLLRRLLHAIRTPAASTIHAVLDRHGLVKPMGPRRKRAQGPFLSEGLLSKRSLVPGRKSVRCGEAK